MRMIPAVLALGLGVFTTGCAREQRAEVAADSVRVADSAQLAARAADSISMARATARTTAKPGENIVAVTEQVPGLLASAKVLPIDAQHLAQTKFPEGTVKGATLERRGGDLIYTYEIQQKAVDGTELVLVDAFNGTLISSMHKDATVAQKPKRP